LASIDISEHPSSRSTNNVQLASNSLNDQALRLNKRIIFIFAYAGFGALSRLVLDRKGFPATESERTDFLGINWGNTLESFHYLSSANWPTSREKHDEKTINTLGRHLVYRSCQLLRFQQGYILTGISKDNTTTFDLLPSLGSTTIIFFRFENPRSQHTTLSQKPS